MVLNATAAIAVAGALACRSPARPPALATTPISAMRMDTRRAPSGAIVINDAYNANPMSMRAALESLAALPADRRVAILGVMAELDDPDAAHAEVARSPAGSASSWSRSAPICTACGRPTIRSPSWVSCQRGMRYS